MAANGENIEHGITVGRLTTLTDGIFAISMTLLFWTINLPGMGKELAPITVKSFFTDQFQEFFNCAVSFLLLANFWIMHHQQFYYIKRTDRRHMWINLVILMFPALVPFSTSLEGDYPSQTIPSFFFASNMFILGMLFLFNWVYSTKEYRLIGPNLDIKHIRLIRRRSLVLPLVSLLAMIMAVVYPLASLYVFLLVPVLIFVPQIYQKSSKRAEVRT